MSHCSDTRHGVRQLQPQRVRPPRPRMRDIERHRRARPRAGEHPVQRRHRHRLGNRPRQRIDQRTLTRRHQPRLPGRCISTAEAPGGAAELHFRCFLFSSIVAGGPLHARPRIRPNGPETFPQFRSQKTLTGKLSVRDHCAALGLAPAMTLMRESAKEQAAPRLNRSVRTHVTTDSRVRYRPEPYRPNGLPSA